MEMAKRCLGHQLRETPQTLDNPNLLEQFVRAQIGLETIEKFLVIGMNSRLQVISHTILSTGTVNKTAVYPREVVKFGITHHVSRMMIAHNHPSGDCTPSQADDQLTHTLKQALELIDIDLVDHLVVSPQHAFSYRQARRWPFVV